MVAGHLDRFTAKASIDPQHARTGGDKDCVGQGQSRGHDPVGHDQEPPGADTRGGNDTEGEGANISQSHAASFPFNENAVFGYALKHPAPHCGSNKSCRLPLKALAA